MGSVFHSARLKEVFHGFSVPLRPALSVHLRNLSREDENTSREARLFDSRDEGVDRKQNLGGSKYLQDYFHDRKKKFSFDVLIRLT